MKSAFSQVRFRIGNFDDVLFNYRFLFGDLKRKTLAKELFMKELKRDKTRKNGECDSQKRQVLQNFFYQSNERRNPILGKLK